MYVIHLHIPFHISNTEILQRKMHFLKASWLYFFVFTTFFWIFYSTIEKVLQRTFCCFMTINALPFVWCGYFFYYSVIWTCKPDHVQLSVWEWFWTRLIKLICIYLKFCINLKASDDRPFTIPFQISVTAVTTSVKIENLNLQSEYEIYVKAQNKFGFGGRSNTIYIDTGEVLSGISAQRCLYIVYFYV